jgi:hypothetical protein
MSDDLRRDLRGMAATGKLPFNRDIVDNFTDGQAALLITVSDMRTEFNGLFGKTFEAISSLKSDVQTIKTKQAETNGHVGEALAKLATVENIEARRRELEVGKVNFRKGLIYIPTAILSFLQNPPVLLALGGIGTWLLHHFKFIP